MKMRFTLSLVVVFVLSFQMTSAQILPPQVMVFPMNGASTEEMNSIVVPKSVDYLGVSKTAFRAGSRPTPPVVPVAKVEGEKSKLGAYELYCAQDALAWLNSGNATTEVCAALVKMPDGKFSYEALAARANARLSGSDKRNYAGTGLGEGKAAQIALQQLGTKVFALLIQPIESKIETEDKRGIQMDYDFALFQLNVTSFPTAAAFASSKPTAILLSSGTVSGIATNMIIGEGGAPSGTLAGVAGAAAQKVAGKVQKTESELRVEAHKKASESLFLYFSRKNEAFRPTAAVEMVAAGKVRAELGKKEGLRTDDRYAVLEAILLEDGTVERERKGVLRAMRPEDNTSSLADSIALSKFYRTGGGKPSAGMQIQAMPDIGLSISLGYGTNAWLRLAYRTKLIPGLKAYVEFNPMRGNLKAKPEFFQTLVASDPLLQEFAAWGVQNGDVSVLSFSLTGGISLEKQLTSFLAIEPFIGAGYSEVSTTGNLVEFEYLGVDLGGFQFSAEGGYIYDSYHALAGLRLPINITHNIHIEPSIGWAYNVAGGMNSNALLEYVDTYGETDQILTGYDPILGTESYYGIDFTQYELSDVFTGDLVVMKDLVWDVMLRIEF